jgi:hypothetical protein
MDEYTTFRERIGQAATALEGRRVRIELHENSKTEPDELYETLKPFKEKVAEDIKESEDSGE